MHAQCVSWEEADRVDKDARCDKARPHAAHPRKDGRTKGMTHKGRSPDAMAAHRDTHLPCELLSLGRRAPVADLGAELLRACAEHGLSVSEVMMRNEQAWRSESQVRSQDFERTAPADGLDPLRDAGRVHLLGRLALEAEHHGPVTAVSLAGGTERAVQLGPDGGRAFE